MAEVVTDGWCLWCRTTEPVNGYVCEFCTFDELQRIRHLPRSEVRSALEALDRVKYGYVRSQEEHLRHAGEALERLKADWGIQGPPTP